MSRQEYSEQDRWQADAEDGDWTTQSPRTTEPSQRTEVKAQLTQSGASKKRSKRKPRGLVSYYEDDDEQGEEEEDEEEKAEESEEDDSADGSQAEQQDEPAGEGNNETPPVKSKSNIPRVDSASAGLSQSEDEHTRRRYTSTSHDLSQSLSKQLEQFDSASPLGFEVDGECNPAVQKRVEEAYAKLVDERQSGNYRSWNDRIQSLKAFRNPSIYEKLLDYIGIDEKGSNFETTCALFNRESFYDELARVQQEEIERLAAQQKAQRTKVEFVSKRPTALAGTNSQSAGNTNVNVRVASSTEAQPTKRSKWDAPTASNAAQSTSLKTLK